MTVKILTHTQRETLSYMKLKRRPVNTPEIASHFGINVKSAYIRVMQLVNLKVVGVSGKKRSTVYFVFDMAKNKGKIRA